jgi:hypothetical protein
MLFRTGEGFILEYVQVVPCFAICGSLTIQTDHLHGACNALYRALLAIHCNGPVLAACRCQLMQQEAASESTTCPVTGCGAIYHHSDVIELAPEIGSVCSSRYLITGWTCL